MEKYLILFIGLVVLGVVTIILINKIPKTKIIFLILYPVLIVFIGIKVFESVKQPIEFQKAKDKRYQAVIDRLKEIRTAQVAYKELNGKYAPSFDSLLHFIKTDSFNVVRAIGNVPDTLTEAEAVEMGLVTRDTVKEPVRDSLFPPPYPLDSLRYIPYGNGAEFFMGADSVKTGSEIVVQVFEAHASNDVILKGLNRQEIINLNAEMEKLGRYKGLKVGSLEEPNNNAGSWSEVYD